MLPASAVPMYSSCNYKVYNLVSVCTTLWIRIGLCMCVFACVCVREIERERKRERERERERGKREVSLFNFHPAIHHDDKPSKYPINTVALAN